MRFDGKVALVTGAARGIGAAIVEGFVDAGAAVIAFDLDGEGVRELSRRLCSKGKVIPLAGDVTDEANVRDAVERTVREGGRLDVLVNNAGIELTGPVPEFTADQWDRQLAVNLKAAFLFARHAIPQMRGRGGAIVNISSVHAFVSYPHNAAYDASKAGLLALTRTLALDHGCDGIRTNAICPGYIDTPMLDQALSALPDREAVERRVMAAHPLGRIGTPADVANAVLFLASEEAAFISGTYLVVDGGMTVAGH